MIGLELPSLAITSETPLKRAIQEYMSKRPEIARTSLEIFNFLMSVGIRTMLRADLQVDF